jgi:hypothetical protein
MNRYFLRRAIKLVKFRSNLVNCYAKEKTTSEREKMVWKNCVINFYDYDSIVATKRANQGIKSHFIHGTW